MAKAKEEARPILIDEQDGPCEICTSHNDGKCDQCGKTVPVYENMGGSGYRSPKPTHFHLRQVLGVNGREAIFSELCRNCYCDAWEGAYPNKKCQIKRDTKARERAPL